MPSAGAVLIDGKDIQCYDPKWLKKKVRPDVAGTPLHEVLVVHAQGTHAGWKDDLIRPACPFA